MGLLDDLLGDKIEAASKWICDIEIASNLINGPTELSPIGGAAFYGVQDAISAADFASSPEYQTNMDDLRDGVCSDYRK